MKPQHSASENDLLRITIQKKGSFCQNNNFKGKKLFVFFFPVCLAGLEPNNVAIAMCMNCICGALLFEEQYVMMNEKTTSHIYHVERILEHISCIVVMPGNKTVDGNKKKSNNTKKNGSFLKFLV